jgi:ribonuclease HII
MAAAVVLPRRMPQGLGGLIDDSKKLNAAQREAAFAALMVARARGAVEIGLGAASVSEIGRLNILRASLLAMRRAVLRLPSVPDLALVDGNQAPELPCAVRCIVGGDASEAAIAAASIVAKVVRDRCMARLDRRYPGYGWPENAGYATAGHRAALRALGATVHHRAGFGTVRQLVLGL